MTKEDPKETLIKKLIKKEFKTQTVLNQAKREIAKKFEIPIPSMLSY